MLKRIIREKRIESAKEIGENQPRLIDLTTQHIHQGRIYTHPKEVTQ